MKKETLANCPICFQEIRSDAQAFGYCRLCGMSTAVNKEFCCQDCSTKFKKIKGGLYGRKISGRDN
ncbi:MAG: hypothetical protein V1678_04480 [Candidatus Aenigmatarchaeota archaeon]